MIPRTLILKKERKKSQGGRDIEDAALSEVNRSEMRGRNSVKGDQPEKDSIQNANE